MSKENSDNSPFYWLNLCEGVSNELPICSIPMCTDRAKLPTYSGDSQQAA